MSRLLIGLALLWSSSLVLGCGDGGNGHLPPPGDGDADADADGDSDADGDADPPACIRDDDGDGYGVSYRNGCLGPDCDDSDPDVWDDCSTCPEGIARKNCPCFGTEDPVDCHSTDLYEDLHGRLRCKNGLMSCVPAEEPDTFVWGLCVFPDGTSE